MLQGSPQLPGCRVSLFTATIEKDLEVSVQLAGLIASYCMRTTGQRYGGAKNPTSAVLVADSASDREPSGAHANNKVSNARRLQARRIRRNRHADALITKARDFTPSQPLSPTPD